MQLAKCPCGKQPERILISECGQGWKYMLAMGNCCGEWIIEFRANYHKPESPECMTLAVAAWNGARRGVA